MAELAELVTGSKFAELSCEAHFRAWLGGKKPEVSAVTYDFYSGTVNKFLNHLGPRAAEPIEGITRADIIEYRNDMAGLVKAKTVNHNLTVLKMAFRTAKRDGLISEDPTEFVDTLKLNDTGKRRGFTRAEIASVLSVADPEWKSLVLFGLYTGQRLGDLARLTWANVDQERNELRFVASKTGKRVILPMALPLRKHVASLPTADSLDVPLHPKAYVVGKGNGTLSTQFGELLIQAGLREKKNQKQSGRTENELSFHSLRHSCVTFLHEAGLPQATVETYVGHGSSAVNRTYTHIGNAELSRAAAALPDIVRRSVGCC